MAQAGAAIGSAFAPGLGTAIGSIAGGLLDSTMMGGGSVAQPAPPSSSSAAVAVYGSGLNADNWNLNFAGTQTNKSAADKSLSATGPTATTAATGGTIMPQPSGGLGLDLSGLTGSMQGVPLWAWGVLGAAVLWRLKSRK